MKQNIFAVSVIILFATTGCGLSLNAERDTNPVIQDWASPWFSNTAEVFATKASHRLFMIQKQHGVGSNPPKLVTCAEPSPDVGEAFTSAITSAFKAAGNDPNSGINAELAGNYARAVATQIAPLIYRTQGLQIYRDGLHSLCVDHMNGWISDADYAARKTDLLNIANQLITAEKDVMLQAQQTFFQSVKAGDVNLSIGEITKIVEALKSTNATNSTNNSTTTTTVTETKEPADTEK
jgi:hypothetical protein